MTTKQIKFVRGLLSKAGLMDEKEEIVWNLTDGRTTHLTEMTYQETQEIIKMLKGQEADTRQNCLNKIFSQMHEMEWEHSNGKVDMSKLDEWCVKYTPFHVPLDDIDDDNIPLLVTLFDKVYQSFLKGI